MQSRHHIYSWLIAAWLLWGAMCSSVCASPQPAQPALWSTTPTFSEDIRPAYQFRSTSAFTTTTNTTVFTPMAGSPTNNGGGPYRPRRGGYYDNDGNWVDPEDEPIGVLPDPAPIGEPIILLLFALLFLGAKKVYSVKCKV